MNYADYLARKKAIDVDTGIAQPSDMHPSLFGYQADIVRWALRRGRAAVTARSKAVSQGNRTRRSNERRRALAMFGIVL